MLVPVSLCIRLTTKKLIIKVIIIIIMIIIIIIIIIIMPFNPRDLYYNNNNNNNKIIVRVQGLLLVANLWFGGWFGGFHYPVNPGRPEWSKVQTRGKPLVATAQTKYVSAGE